MYLPHILLGLYLILFVVCGIDPYNRAIWINENAPVVILVVILILTYKKYKFSNTSYILMFIGMVTQTIGGHYTFSRVPFDRFNEAFGFTRNMYDRVGHFALGLYAYPLAEYFDRKKLFKKRWMIYAMIISILFAVASLYEIIERAYQAFSGGKNGAAFLGSQGDKWDAQKDMLADGLGAILSSLLYRFNHRKK